MILILIVSLSNESHEQNFKLQYSSETVLKYMPEESKHNLFSTVTGFYENASPIYEYIMINNYLINKCLSDAMETWRVGKF